MSQIYEIPPDTHEREKIVGGVLDYKQVMWIAAGFVLCAIETLVLYKLVGFFGLILGLPWIAVGAVFAVKKKYEMPLFTYLVYKIKFNKKIKKYINSGIHKELEYSDKR